MKYRELYEFGCGILQKAGVEEYAADARLLLEHACGTDHNTLLAHPEMTPLPEQEERYKNHIEARSRRIPLQYITGEQEFMGLTFEVNKDVLIPRQDTEILVEEAMQELHDGMRILDLCTGSGCILLSLLHYSNDCTGVGTDLSEKALATAERNAERLSCSGVSFVQSDLFEQVQGTFDMIVSNPPYIATAVIDTLMPEVREHEPRMALDGAEDGLFFYKKIVAEGAEYLCPGGHMMLEIGCDQGEAVSALMEQAGFREVMVKKDFAGLDRVVCGAKAIRI